MTEEVLQRLSSSWMAIQTGPSQMSSSLSATTLRVQSSHHYLTAVYPRRPHRFLDQEGGHHQARMVEGVERTALGVEATGVAMEEEVEGAADSTIGG